MIAALIANESDTNQRRLGLEMMFIQYGLLVDRLKCNSLELLQVLNTSAGGDTLQHFIIASSCEHIGELFTGLIRAHGVYRAIS